MPNAISKIAFINKDLKLISSLELIPKFVLYVVDQEVYRLFHFSNIMIN